ncbi:glycosyltransferase [Lentzea sp. HUAS12]|uniref:glycosyltransferase n=1 Tax=Lentzea sp. HUAS12 TaxID=2951806 RepID=UPI00209CFDAC|nr:glycosyltransferase [Lentzea sp. HUAS12]USX54767.1 glycosyltransferase [Lentzea sp. HUAS12]
MKIAMVSVHGGPLADASGPQEDTPVTGLSAALARQGHEVTVYHRRDRPDAPERIRTDRGVEVVLVPAGPLEPFADEHVLPHIGDFTSFILQDWASSPPDVVHGHRWMSGMVSVLGGRRAGVPVVQTFHSLAAAEQRDCPVDTASDERRRIEVLVGREAAHVTAGSAGEAFELARTGVKRTKISVVPGGVDVAAFTPEGPRAPRDRPFRVVTPLHRRHTGAVVTALSRIDGAELVVSGLPAQGDPVVEKLRERGRQAGTKVVFARAVTPELLRSADAVVCASSYEPSGALALEAMACGVPVVASAVDALADVVVDGVTGLLVPAGEQEGLARALRSLLLNDTLRDEFSVAGHDRVMARYSWDHVAADFLRVYERAGAPTGTPIVAR